MGSGPSKGAPVRQAPDEADEAPPKVDTRLPFPQFRELFTLKNYWKTVRRNDKECGNAMFAKYVS